MSRRIITGLLGAATLVAGCSSGVKLNDVPVEDKSATSVGPGGAGGTPGGATRLWVAPPGVPPGPPGATLVALLSSTGTSLSLTPELQPASVAAISRPVMMRRDMELPPSIS